MTETNLIDGLLAEVFEKQADNGWPSTYRMSDPFAPIGPGGPGMGGLVSDMSAGRRLVAELLAEER